MKRCYACGGKLILTKDIVIRDGKSYPIEVEMCEKCGETFSNLEETAKVRKKMFPSIFHRIKTFFCGSENTELSWLRGKVL